MKSQVQSIIALAITSLCVALLLAGCDRKTAKETDSGEKIVKETSSSEKSALIGSWQTVEVQPTIFNFQEDHTFAMKYKGGGSIVQNASAKGTWRQDGDQLVIVRTSIKMNGSTVSPSNRDGTTTWTILSITDSTMTWSNSVLRPGFSHPVELKLERVSAQ